MKQAYFVARPADPAAHIRPCRIEGCDGLAWDTDICNCCAGEIAALDSYYASRDDRRDRMRRASRRLLDSAYAVAVVGMMAWILFEFRGFVIDTLTLWFGGK